MFLLIIVLVAESPPSSWGKPTSIAARAFSRGQYYAVLVTALKKAKS